MLIDKVRLVPKSGSWYNLSAMQTINVPVETFEKLVSRLEELTREVKAIKVKFFDQEPSYGSKEWWEWSEKKADEDIKTGRVSTVLRNKKELQYFLDSLKTS